MTTGPAPSPVIDDLEFTEAVRGRRLKAFGDFTKLQIASCDIDPAYPVLKWLERGMDDEAALGFSISYVAFYNLTSTLRYHGGADYEGLPTGIERRGLRLTKNMGEHLASMEAQRRLHGSWEGWLGCDRSGSPDQDWAQVRENISMAKFNGRWASYKVAEILQKVHGWSLVAPDMGNEGSTGPVDGLRLLYPEAKTVSEADFYAQILLPVAERHGATGFAQLETLLCDFHSMHRGHYYNGHDIDGMLEQTHKAEGDVRETLLEARHAALPRNYLGELHGWTGRREHLEKFYRLTGEVVSGAHGG